MIEIVILGVLLLAQDNGPVFSVTEARSPTRQSLRFEALCGESSLALSGVGVSIPSSENPVAEIDGKRVELPPGLKEFLREDRSAYRLSAVCPPTAPKFQLSVYRAHSLAEGEVSYSVYSVDVDAYGHIIDRGGSISNADTFWFR